MIEQALVEFLREQGLAGASESGTWSPLSGGVSSDIWHVQTSRGEFCVKRALAKLKVAADWSAPVERNAFEWAYLEVATKIALVPFRVLSHTIPGAVCSRWRG